MIWPGLQIFSDKRKAVGGVLTEVGDRNHGWRCLSGWCDDGGRALNGCCKDLYWHEGGCGGCGGWAEGEALEEEGRQQHSSSH